MSFDYSFKFILVGDTAVGKTSILNRFLAGNFDYKH
jgi:GTPase SAR1 family protein